LLKTQRPPMSAVCSVGHQWAAVTFVSVECDDVSSIAADCDRFGGRVEGRSLLERTATLELAPSSRWTTEQKRHQVPNKNSRPISRPSSMHAPWRVTTRRQRAVVGRPVFRAPFARDGAGFRNGGAGTDRCVGQRFLMMSERIGRMVTTEKDRRVTMGRLVHQHVMRLAAPSSARATVAGADRRCAGGGRRLA